MPRIYHLNPGIDIVGGTSLLYKITPAPREGSGTGQLASDSRRKRFLSSASIRAGVKNLIWRPPGRYAPSRFRCLSATMPGKALEGAKENLSRQLVAAQEGA